MNNSEDKQVAAWDKVMAALNAEHVGIGEADRHLVALRLLDGSYLPPEKGEPDAEPPAP